MSIHHRDLGQAFEDFWKQLHEDKPIVLPGGYTLSVEFGFEIGLANFCRVHNFNTLFACEIDGVEYRLVRTHGVDSSVPGD